MTDAARRTYVRRFIPTMIAYAAILFAVSAILAGESAPIGAAAYALAILPALPVLALLWIMARYLVDEQDEYLRMLMVRQSLIATALTLSLATLWGFLEVFAAAPHIPLLWVAATWFAGLGVGALVNRITE